MCATRDRVRRLRKVVINAERMRLGIKEEELASRGNFLISASALLLSLKRILDRRRRLPDAAHAHRRAVGDEQQLVSAAFIVGRCAGDISHPLRSEIASLAAGTG